MEARKITKEEIKLLDAFCKKKDVIYVDLRLEIVDHLADSMEELWEENPEMSFQKALQTVYKRFGIFGFLDVVGEHQNRMTKRYMKLFWKTIVEVVAWPRIVGFVLMSLALYQSMITFYDMRFVGKILFAAVLIMGTFVNLYKYFQNKKILDSEFTVLMKSPIQIIAMILYGAVQVILRPRYWSAEGVQSEYAPLILTILIMISLLFFLTNLVIQYKTEEELVELKKRLV